MAFITGGKNPMDVFPFLDERTAYEPFIYEVLCEIEGAQKSHISGKNPLLATKKSIHASRNIKMPFTPARDKNLDYILDLLIHRFPLNINRIVSFEFSFDDVQKKLILNEIEEYGVNLTREQIERITRERDQKSADSMNALISRFRIFNLSKLMGQANFRQDLNRIIQIAINRSIFAYKNYGIDRGQIIVTDEFCFHSSNYEHIKKTLDIKKIIPIISNRSDLIKVKLKNYGILSIDFSDYRDNKLDYILHILSDSLTGSISMKELLEVKNFQALRECILRVDKVLDPARIYSTDIARMIRENSLVSSHDIYAGILSVTPEVLKNWARKDILSKESIYLFREATGVEWFIEGRKFIGNFGSLFESMRSDPARFAALPQHEREAQQGRLEVMHQAALAMLEDREAPFILKATPEEMESLEHIVEEFESYMKQRMLRSEVSRPVAQPKGSLVKAIIGFFKGIFSVFSSDDDESEDSSISASSSSSDGSARPAISKEARIIYKKSTNFKAPIIPLSEMIELTRENDTIVDKIISDLRTSNLKIVMPVYNARSSLYPKRSAKLLIPDIEYLLIPIEAIRTPESITAYVDTLVGFKMKDDVISGNMLIVIEKYLRTIQRQKKNMMRREAAKASLK